MAYSKLHSSIVNSSLWTEPDCARILFVTLLAMCDRDGIVYGSRSGIARLANINPEDQETAWSILMSPDKESSDRIRAPEHEGRRVEEVSGGYRLLNFSYYRGLRNDDDRREQNRAAQARFKAKTKPQKPDSATVSHDKPPKAHTEAETEAESETDSEAASKTELHSSVSRTARVDAEALEVVEAWNAMAKANGLAQVLKFSDGRKRHVSARLRDPFFKANWRKALEIFAASDFCRGLIPNRSWRANFDFFLKPDSVVKAMEGSYANRDTQPGLFTAQPKDTKSILKNAVC